MRNFKIIAITLFISAFTVSCDDFKDFDTERPDYARFSTIIQPDPPVTPPLNATIRLETGMSGQRELGVFSSIVFDSDRTFNINAVSEIGAENYNFPATVTIPAGKDRTSIIFEATNISIPSDPSQNPVTLILSPSADNTSSEVIVTDFIFTLQHVN